MNETVKTYCDETGLVFTRCRPYRKNDQAWVEQKNGAVVRHAVGYRRYEGVEAAAALARLYAALRLFVNFFQPSFKLAGKARDGAKVKKSYHAPPTPYQRLLENPRTSEKVRRRVTALYVTLDPVELLREVRAAQQALVDIADRPASGEAMAPMALTSGRGAPDQSAEGEGQARTAASRSVRVGGGANARMVRGRTVADGARTV